MNRNELDTLLADHQIYHSDLQMDCFITGLSGGTVYGMYKQALRKIYKRYRGLRQLFIDHERRILKIERLEASKALTGLTAKKNALDVRETRAGLEDLERNIQDTEREFRRFYAQAVALKRKVGDLTPQRRTELEIELWTHHLKARAALEMMTSGVVGLNTTELIVSLPRSMRDPLMAELGDRQNLLTWFKEYESPILDLAEIEITDDVRRFLESGRASITAEECSA